MQIDTQVGITSRNRTVGGWNNATAGSAAAAAAAASAAAAATTAAVAAAVAAAAAAAADDKLMECYVRPFDSLAGVPVWSIARNVRCVGCKGPRSPAMHCSTVRVTAGTTRTQGAFGFLPRSWPKLPHIGEDTVRRAAYGHFPLGGCQRSKRPRMGLSHSHPKAATPPLVGRPIVRNRR